MFKLIKHLPLRSLEIERAKHARIQIEGSIGLPPKPAFKADLSLQRDKIGD